MSIIIDGSTNIRYLNIDGQDLTDGSGYITIDGDDYYYGIFKTPRVNLTETTGFNSTGYIYNDNNFLVYVHTREEGASSWESGGYGWPSYILASSSAYSGSNNVTDSHEVCFSVIYPAGQRVYSMTTWVDENDDSEQKGTQLGFDAAERDAGIV